MWTFQRLLFPAVPRDAYYGAATSAWPDAFRSTLDPLAVLTWVAARTRRVRLGVSVLIMPFYAPVVLAKQLATLDFLSGGRLEVGLGLGWSRDELEAAGAPAGRRGARADEFVRCLRAVWSGEEVELAGEFVRVPRARLAPPPLQRPHPPILLGGYHDAVLRRAAALADGYTLGNVPLASLADIRARLEALWREAGRDPGTLRVVCRGAYHVMPPGAPDRRPLWGSLGEIREDLARYAAAGATELFLDPNFQPGGPALDRVLGEMEALAPR